MRVLFTGGGTGGHVYPALAIAKEILRHESDSTIAFVGTSHGIENKLVPREGFTLHHIEIQGLRRSLSLQNFKTLYLTLTSVPKAKRLIRSFRPDVVIGTGGYVCYPLIRAAAALGVPTALHESNVQPGMAVRMLADKTDLLFLNFEQSRQYLKHPEKAMCVGNPLRFSPGQLTKAQARTKLGIPQDVLYLLSLGGSMGAEQVNFCMLDVMEQYSAKQPDVFHLHGTGSIEWDVCKKLFAQKGLNHSKNLVLCEYIDDMPIHLAAADLVINRAGSITLSELALCGKPSILIPSPNVTDNHQFRNACVLRDAGAAIVIEEKDLHAKTLAAEIDRLLRNPKQLQKMAESAASLAVPDAAEKIYFALTRLLTSRRT